MRGYLLSEKRCHDGLWGQDKKLLLTEYMCLLWGFCCVPWMLQKPSTTILYVCIQQFTGHTKTYRQEMLIDEEFADEFRSVAKGTKKDHARILQEITDYSTVLFPTNRHAILEDRIFNLSMTASHTCTRFLPFPINKIILPQKTNSNWGVLALFPSTGFLAEENIWASRSEVSKRAAEKRRWNDEAVDLSPSSLLDEFYSGPLT